MLSERFGGVNTGRLCEISDFRRELDVNCAILGYYAACNGNYYRRLGTIHRFHVRGSRIIEPKRR